MRYYYESVLVLICVVHLAHVRIHHWTDIRACCKKVFSNIHFAPKLVIGNRFPILIGKTKRLHHVQNWQFWCPKSRYQLSQSEIKASCQNRKKAKIEKPLILHI